MSRPCSNDFETLLEESPDRVLVCTVFTASAAASRLEERRGSEWIVTQTTVCPNLGMPHKHHVISRNLLPGEES